MSKTNLNMTKNIGHLIAMIVAGLCFGGNGAALLIAAENTTSPASVTATKAEGAEAAVLRLSGIFCDNMVLQRDKPAPVFGSGPAGEKVTVEFAGQTKQAQADIQGRWLVALDPLPASAEGRTMTLRAASKAITLRNIVVGEVWFCSGQSNMALTLGEAGHAQEEQTLPANPQLRVFSARQHCDAAPSDEVRDGYWANVTPSNISAIYATAYYFGKLLQRDLKLPVGLIQSAWGGTPVQAWMSRPMLAGEAEMDAIATRGLADNQEGLQKNQAYLAGGGDPKKLPWPAWRSAQTPTWLFNGMVNPYIPYAIRGVIWYQGEHNILDPLPYGKMFPSMIRGWREAWGEGEFPFYFCQLPGLKMDPPHVGKLATLRAMQASALELPNTGMAVIYDTAEEHDNHPKNKRPAGERLALLALNRTYGQTVECSGPTYAGMRVEGERIRIRFEHALGGLIARELPAVYRPVSSKPETMPLVRTSPGGQLEGFQLRAKDGQWQWADAQIDGTTVVAESKQVPQPVAVRYAWADFGFFNLFNKAGLPAAPFDSGLKASKIISLNSLIQ